MLRHRARHGESKSHNTALLCEYSSSSIHDSLVFSFWVLFIGYACNNWCRSKAVGPYEQDGQHLQKIILTINVPTKTARKSRVYPVCIVAWAAQQSQREHGLAGTELFAFGYGVRYRDAFGYVRPSFRSNKHGRYDPLQYLLCDAKAGTPAKGLPNGWPVRKGQHKAGRCRK